MSMRSSISSDAISKYVAHCLIQHYDHIKNCRKRGLELTGQKASDAQSFVESPASRVSALSELVAPGASSHITLTVATVAKIYAQRLVKAARDVATSQSGYPPDDALLPEHVLVAYEKRLKCGKDPGFYMQGSSGRHVSFNYLAFQRSLTESLKAQEFFDTNCMQIDDKSSSSSGREEEEAEK